MKRSLWLDIGRLHLLNILVFGLLIFILVSVLSWVNLVEAKEDRLFTLAMVIAVVMERHGGPLDKASDDPEALRSAIEPILVGIIQSYPAEYTIGYYSRDLDRVISGVSGDPSVKITGVTLPLGDPGRRCWELREPQYKLIWRDFRRQWILKCDYPVILDGRVIGHTFANVTLASMMRFQTIPVAGLLLIIIIAAGLLSIGLSKLGRRRLKANLAMLSLIDGPGTQGRFDYEEFDHVAQVNRRAFASLIAAERDKAEMLANFPWGYAVVNAAGTIVKINENGASMLGMKPDAIIGGSIARWWPSDPSVTGFLCQTAYEIKEFECPGPGGENRTYYICTFPFHPRYDEEGAMIWFIDITERKRVEERLRQAAIIVESSEDAIIALTAEGLIQSWNRGAAKIYGYAAAEVIGTDAGRLFTKSSHDRFSAALARARIGEAPGILETAGLRRDGANLDISITISPITDEQGATIGLATIHRDITREKRTEQELAAERERLSVTLNSIADGVVAMDRDGRIVLMNRVAEDLTDWAWTAAEGEYLPWILKIIDDETGQPCERIAEDVLSHGATVHMDGVTLISKAGREIPISLSGALIESPSGERLGVVLVFRDATEKRRIEEELLKTEKLEALGILAGGIAHDFNNTLAACLAHIQLALTRLDKGRPVEDCLRATVETIYKASELTRQLLTFAKGGAPIRQSASIAELVLDTVEFVLHGSNIKCQFNLEPDLREVEIDKGQISQVVQNLVINAKQAMPKGGVLEISARNVTADKGRGQAEHYVELVLKDNGAGIPRENLSKIFDPFFTTKKDGNGLGLATSYSIIRKHEGYIEVDSRPGAGTIFTVFLPASSAPVSQDRGGQAVVDVGLQLKILLMDDEEHILHAMGAILTECGHFVEVARDGREAIELYLKAGALGEPYDVVIMDLTIPGGMGGQEAIALLREIDPGIKAIVSSGYANDPVMANHAQYGFCGMVVKPYKLDELNMILQRVARADTGLPPASLDSA